MEKSSEFVAKDSSFEDQVNGNGSQEIPDETQGFRFLKINKSPTSELLELLNNNVIGTPGQGMLYQHFGVVDKMNSISNPYFANLRKNDRIIGTCCFCKRTDGNLISFYIRYFSFRSKFRRKIIKEEQPNRRSELRNEIESLLLGNGLEVNPKEKFFHYAYVNPRNTRSVRLCKEFGFESVRQYTTIIFSRFFPKASNETEIVETSADNKEIRDILADFYKNFKTLTTENSTGRKYYYVRNSDGIIVAGVQVNPERWSIYSLPGPKGKLILNTFPYLPLLNRLVNTDYRFLTLEAIFVKSGFEKVLEKLFESLLFKYRVYSAITLVDSQTELYITLKSLDLGLANKINKETRGDVIFRFNNFTQEEKHQFLNHPVYISGIDVT